MTLEGRTDAGDGGRSDDGARSEDSGPPAPPPGPPAPIEDAAIPPDADDARVAPSAVPDGAVGLDLGPVVDRSAEFFRIDTLHRVDITIDPAIWALYMEDHRSFGLRLEPKWFQADFAIDGIVLRNVAFHTFGWGSRDEAKMKPNLSLDIDRIIKGQSLHGIKRIRLKNNGQDVTGLRQMLTYQMMREAGVVMAPRSSYAELFVNGEPYGFYFVEEGFSKQYVRERTGNDDGPAYEAQDCRGFVAPAEGGCERILSYYNRDFNPMVGTGEDLVALCQAMNGPPEQFMAAVGALVHLPEWIDLVAADTALAGDHDGFSVSASNFRLYHDTAMKKLRLIVLGPDTTFRPEHLPIPDPLRPQPKAGCLNDTPDFRDIFLERLTGTPEGLALWKQSVRRLRTGVASLERMRERVTTTWIRIGPRVKADTRRPPHADPELEVGEIMRYLNLRWEALAAAGM